MKLKNYQKYSLEDFLNDDQFIKWVLYPDEEGDTMLEGLQKRFPEKRQLMREAAVLIKLLHPQEPVVLQGRINAMWDRINQKITEKKRRALIKRKSFTYLKYAAVILFMMALGGGYYKWTVNNVAEFSYAARSIDGLNEGKIILPDGGIKYFNTKKTIIKHIQGGIMVNADTLLKENIIDQHSERSELIRIVVPYGMHTDVYLSDGTHVYLNSGSVFSYPLEFRKRDRKVFLSGEAFFEVEKDKNRPFLVFTDNLRIKVTGTRFNVQSYDSDKTTQVVLVEGKVSIRKKENIMYSMPLNPGERAVLELNSNKLQKDKVEVQPYISWIKGYLIFQRTPIREVVRKLERYYNTKIEIEKDIEDIRFSGKLDLNSGITEAISYISFASSVSYSTKNNCITLYKPTPMGN